MEQPSVDMRWRRRSSEDEEEEGEEEEEETLIYSLAMSTLDIQTAYTLYRPVNDT